MTSCPLPLDKYPTVVLGHGGGGRLSQNLIESLFISAFGNSHLYERHDGAVFTSPSERLAMSTDSYVVKPLFFKGGDIGTLAVNGTVNDLAMCGAEALYISLGLIIEEGFPMEKLWVVIQSIKNAAQESQVKIITGDTKVVEKGKADGIYINTSGVGKISHDQVISPKQIQNGDVIILSGDIGRHGMAIMAQRENLGFESEIISDCASLKPAVLALLQENIQISCMRDLTRGGLASALVEIAESAKKQIHIKEHDIPVSLPVRSACEILGFDPLHVANEGTFIIILPDSQAQKVLKILKNIPMTKDAVIIGEVKEGVSSICPGQVILHNPYGTGRLLDMLSGEQLPRIC